MRRGPWRHRQEGGVAVEFAVLLPLILLLVMGVIEFGRAYNAKIELASAVREAARALALGADTATAQAVVETGAGNLATAPVVSDVVTCPPGDADGNASLIASHDLEYHIFVFGTGTWTIQAKGVMRCGV